MFSWGRPEDEDWDGRSVFSWGCPEGRAAQAKGSVFSWSEASSRSASRVGPLEPLAPPETQRAIGRPARPRPACDEGRRPTRPSRKAPRTKKLRATSAALSLSALGRLHAEVQELRRQMALLDPVRGAHVALAPAAVQETREPVGELRSSGRSGPDRMRGGAVSSDLEAILPAEVQVHPSDSPAEGEPVVSSGARERPARPARGLSSREGTRRSRSPSHDYWAEGHEDPGTVPQPNSPKARSARSGTGRLGGRGGDSASGPARTRRPQKASSKLEAQKRSSLASEVSAASENAPSVTDALMEREVSQASAASEKLPLSVEDEAASERRSLEESQRTTSAKDAQVLGDTAGRSSVTVMTYWLQVESIKGLPRLENAETVSLYEVHSYWMEQGGPMVRLAELQAHAADGGEECRVRNQVSLPLFEPAPGAGTVAVEVVRKVPENSKGSFMLVGRVELDALNDDTRRIASYALPPSAAVIKLRVCEHRAAVKASGVVTQPPAATVGAPGTASARAGVAGASPPRSSVSSVGSGTVGAQSLVQVLGEAKAEPRLNEGSVKVTERAEPDAPSQSKQVPEAVEEADEYIYTEEGEEEEIIEDDPIVS